MTADKNRDVSRAYYVRTHAPALLAALIGNRAIPSRGDLKLGLMPVQQSSAQLRAQAIEQAGLLFDETETE